MVLLRQTCLAAALSVLLAALPTPPAAAQLPACACEQLPATVFLGGVYDNYALPMDPVRRGPELSSVNPGGDWSNFDNNNSNLPFGFTFDRLPGDIVCAYLEIHLQPAGGRPDHEALFLGAAPGPPFLEWGTYTVGFGLDPFVLDLGHLPATGISPATSLIAHLNAVRRLDIYVQDDTEVDYVKLTLRTFPLQQMPGGFPDNFAPPFEGVRIGSQLSSAYPSVAWKVLDEATPNRLLGFTFEPITSNVVQAFVETRLRAHLDVPGDDRFNLGLNAGPTFAFTALLADLPTPGGSWNSGDPAKTLMLDLAALPGSINLLPKINADDRLDLIVEDDTQGDYFNLHARSCPPPLRFEGYPYETAGPSIFEPTVNGGFTVTTDGRGGGGVRTAIGYDGFSTITEICLDDLETAFQLTIEGAVLQNSQPTFGTAVLSLLNSGATALLSANFPNPYQVHLSTEVWKEGHSVVAYTSPGTQGTVNGSVATLPASACIEELGLIDGSCFRAVLAAPMPLQLAQGGPQVLGDEIRVCRGDVAGSSFQARSAALTTPNATTFPILGATFRAFGFFERAIGWPGVASNGSGLTVYDLSPVGDEGIALLLGSAASAEATLGPIDPAGAAAAGSFLEAEVLGELGGVGDQSLGTLHVAKEAGDFSVTPDFTAISSPSQRIQVLNGGTVVANVPGHTGVAARVSRWPARIGHLGGPRQGFAAYFPPGSVITVDGVPHAANELRILAETSAAIGSKSELQLRSAGLGELFLAGAAGTPNLVFQDGFESGNLSRWSIALP